MKNCLLVISAFLFIFFLIWGASFAVLKIFKPVVISFLTTNAEWLTKESSEAIISIILAQIYCIIVLLTGVFFCKTSSGRSLMQWFININKKIGIDFSGEATEKRINSIGEKLRNKFK